MNPWTHVVYTLILCQDYIHIWRRLVLNWYSTKSSSTSVHVTASIYNAALYPEYTHNSAVLYTPWRYTQTTSTSVPLCFYTDTLHRVHPRPYPGTQPRLHLRHVRTHPVYTLTFKLDYIDSTACIFNNTVLKLHPCRTRPLYTMPLHPDCIHVRTRPVYTLTLHPDFNHVRTRPVYTLTLHLDCFHLCIRLVYTQTLHPDCIHFRTRPESTLTMHPDYINVRVRPVFTLRLYPDYIHDRSYIFTKRRRKEKDLYKFNSKMIDDWKILFQMDCVLS